MKKLFAAFLAVALLVSLAACGGGDDPPPDSEDNTPSSQQTEQPSNTPDPGTEQPDEQGGESAPPTETTPSGDAMTVAEFLEFYGLSEDDCKPEHFTGLGELKLQGKAGEMTSMGIVDISVDKEQTTEETIISWYTQLYAKLESLSEAGKLYGDTQCAQELTGLDALIEGNPRWEELPGFSCYYPYTLPAGKALLMADAGYDKEAGTYSLMVWVVGFIK